MRCRAYFMILILGLIFTACEKVVDINLNDAASRKVIEAQLSNLTAIQHIRVSETVPFTSAQKSKPIVQASVLVRDNKGGIFTFRHTANGVYEHQNFKPIAARAYTLEVRVGDEFFTSTTVMPAYVTVDSIGLLKKNFIKDDYYFVTLKFRDPSEVNNYYKYDISINGDPFTFAVAYNDKFNNGLYVTHEVGDKDNELTLGDSVVVRRYCVDKAIFNYWNEYQLTNPSSAAPGNPTSNISNNALGYFSVASAKQYAIRVD